MWSNVILLVGCFVSILYWRNIYLIIGVLALTVLGNWYKKYIYVDFKNSVLNQYSRVLFFKLFDKKQAFTNSIKFEIRREEFGDADTGLTHSYVLYFISDFETDILQFDFFNTGKKLLSTLPVELQEINSSIRASNIDNRTSKLCP